MTTQIDIANRSLLAVGARTQISSFSPSDGSDEANAISVLWTPTYEALARTAHWNIFRKQATLSLTAAAMGTPENPSGTAPLPPTPWNYEYAYPSDCLDFHYVVPSNPAAPAGTPPSTTINNAAGLWLPTGGQIPFAVIYVADPNGAPTIQVVTNQEQAQGVYSVNQPNPAAWDSLFQAAMVASLGAYLVPALSLSLPLMNMCIKQAEMAIATARARDGNEGTTAMDHTPDWFAARAGAQGYGSGYNNFGTWGGYCSMSWPVFGSDYGS